MEADIRVCRKTRYLSAKYQRPKKKQENVLLKDNIFMLTVGRSHTNELETNKCECQDEDEMCIGSVKDVYF